ncbi:MAG: hypothetical protein FWG45_01675 [Oscillospiraceae bacterium]|nr:hypothetical protein [Oscillospiraceae bacterium]
MRKMKYTVIGVLTIAMLLVACSNTETSILPTDTEMGSQVKQITDVRVVQSDYSLLDPDGKPVTSTTFEMLLRSDLVVIGEFIEESQGEISQWYDDYGTPSQGLPHSFNRLRVIEVLQGNIEVGEIVTIDESYAVDKNGVLLTLGSRTPMNRDDRWIFFLTHFEGAVEYYEAINHKLGVSIAESEPIYGARMDAGKYPIPNSDILKTMNKRSSSRITPVEIETATLGVFYRDDFNFGLYTDIINHFQIDSQNWVNPGKSFDAKLIEMLQ